MAREENKAVSRYPTRVIDPALLLSLGLSLLVLGGGIIYLLLIPAGLIDLKAVHWLLAIGVVLASLLVAFGPTFLLPPEDIPSRP